MPCQLEVDVRLLAAQSMTMEAHLDMHLGQRMTGAEAPLKPDSESLMMLASLRYLFR